jgi:hypothetical protein
MDRNSKQGDMSGKGQVIRPTQDDARENAQIKLFQLKPTGGRSNKYIPDATIEVEGILYEVELKTSDIAKRQVSTSRNVTLDKLEIYKELWWVFSQYQKTQEGFELTGDHYLAHGQDLEPWLEKQAHKIYHGTKTYGGLEHWNQCKLLLEGKVSPEVMTKLDNSFNKKGYGLNNPKISWKDVQAYGTKLDASRLADHARELIAKWGKRIEEDKQ